MTEVWITIAAVAVASATMKALGPVVLGRRTLPPTAAGVIALLAPALLAARVVANTLTHGRTFAVDARVVGLAVAAVALALRAPILVVIVAAAAATAAVRAFS